MPNEGGHLLHFQNHENNGLSVPAQVEYFSRLESWLDEICDQIAATVKIRTQLQIAADEIFTNICHYAYPEHFHDKTVSFHCSFEPENSELILTFSDHGNEFNPLTHTIDPASRKSRKGGVGLLLVRNFSDALHYERREGQNVLTLTMKIAEKAAE